MGIKKDKIKNKEIAMDLKNGMTKLDFKIFNNITVRYLNTLKLNENSKRNGKNYVEELTTEDDLKIFFGEYENFSSKRFLKIYFHLIKLIK
jgi:hypothetical protein